MLGQRRPVPGSLFLYIPDPGSRISDPGSNNSTKEEGKNTVPPLFFVDTNMTKLYFWIGIEKMFLPIHKNYSTFSKELVPKLSKIWVWIRYPEKTYFLHRILDSGCEHTVGYAQADSLRTRSRVSFRFSPTSQLTQINRQVSVPFWIALIRELAI
jgi:hypothetical protein